MAENTGVVFLGQNKVEVQSIDFPKMQNPAGKKINHGVIHATHKVRDTRIYNIKNRSEHDRLLILEHPLRQQFKLITPEKPTERARDVYRFENSGRESDVRMRRRCRNAALSDHRAGANWKWRSQTERIGHRHNLWGSPAKH